MPAGSLAGMNANRENANWDLLLSCHTHTEREKRNSCLLACACSLLFAIRRNDVVSRCEARSSRIASRRLCYSWWYLRVWNGSKSWHIIIVIVYYTSRIFPSSPYYLPMMITVYLRWNQAKELKSHVIPTNGMEWTIKATRLHFYVYRLRLVCWAVMTTVMLRGMLTRSCLSCRNSTTFVGLFLFPQSVSPYMERVYYLMHASYFYYNVSWWIVFLSLSTTKSTASTAEWGRFSMTFVCTCIATWLNRKG